MDKYRLPKSTIINNVECNFKSDYRDILYIFKIMNDPDLLEGEKILLALENFYETDNYLADMNTAIEELFAFITQCGNVDESGTKSQSNSKPLFDWDKDFKIIVAPINKIIGTDVRGLDYLHWWTFLAAFMEIGECTFNTYVGIRDKLNNGKKLDKGEELIYKEHRDEIILEKKYDATTQALIDEILGKE